MTRSYILHAASPSVNSFDTAVFQQQILREVSLFIVYKWRVKNKYASGKL
jgi:hypothetical protein